MQGRWGIARLAAIVGLALIICLPGKGAAAESGFLRSTDWRAPILAAAASSPLEAQMLGEKPDLSSPNKLKILDSAPGMKIDRENGATLKLPQNLELNISFRYNRNAPSLDPRRPSDTQPLFNYSMDYRLHPNLKVGLSGYLYYPYAEQGFSLNRSFGDRVMGLGPGVKYDLGRWSFVFKSQVETGNRDRGDDLQNWVRVWYAF